MVETYEKEGIIYFKEPYRTNLWEWLDAHIRYRYFVCKSLFRGICEEEVCSID